MAKITIENTREHDITIFATGEAIFATGEDGVVQVTVPGARQDPADKNKLVHGRAEADDAFITAAKKNPVVTHYFEEGWLRIAKQPAKEPAKQEPKQPAKE
ncbi:MAG TPA: hypothetical protein PLE35_08980 [Lentisphaeria bacterium]|nr:hypothetical protein [Lentisphaeria bacterium]